MYAARHVYRGHDLSANLELTGVMGGLSALAFQGSLRKGQYAACHSVFDGGLVG